MVSEIPFLPGYPVSNPGPLARYLPPISDGVISAWLFQHLERRALVIDPFGTSPRVALEAARAGYRVLVTANNPVARSLIETAAYQPSENDLQAALAELSAAHRGDERLEPHIRSLYETRCARCDEPVMAEYFLWERGEPAPYARFYRCKSCGDMGEKPATPDDAKQAAQFSASGIHRARALERVAARDDPDRAHAEEALSVYLPRAVYALFTLINRLDSLSLSPAKRSLLDALLLIAFDQANTLWPHPVQRERPRQLTIPRRFRENNIWLALEEGIKILATPNPEAQHPPGENNPAGTAIPLVAWPALPPEAGGISLFVGRLKDLAETSPNIDIGCVVTALPRPNQAFWTLSALWAGWLWGREAAAPFKSVLRRRRYDWGWHAAALSAAFTHLAPLLSPGAPFLGLVGEAEPGFVTAAMVSADNAGFDLEGMALRAETGQLQMIWQKAQVPTPKKAPPEDNRQAIRQVVIQSAADFLRQRGQPSTYLHIHTAALVGLAQAHLLPARMVSKEGETREEPSPSDSFSHAQTLLKEIFIPHNGFLRYDGSEGSLEVGQWWLQALEETPSDLKTPIAGRFEVALVRHLQKNPGCTLAEIDSALCQIFQGLNTPEYELLHVCLDSYGMQNETGNRGWQLRPEDKPAARREDLRNARAMLYQLGERLGYSVTWEGGPDRQDNAPGSTSIPLLWKGAGGDLRYAFYVLASSTIGEIIFQKEYPPEQSIILMPGGRANLAAFKLRSDPRLRQEVEKGWRFLKYRHLRRLLEDLVLTRETIDEQLLLDPLSYTAPQIRFF